MALQISGVAAGLRIHQHNKHGVAGPSFSFISRSSSISVVGLRSRVRNGFTLIMATPSNSNPNTSSTSGGGEEKVKKPISTTNVSEGPPLPTILAGAVVFFGFCWVLFTIGSWLFYLIVTPPSPK
ncbi:hypothetical protein LINPERHAP2_LOCUS32504 [Linum perenne]